MSAESMDLVWPDAQYLSGHVDALQQGWSPDTLRPQAALDELARIAADPDRFVSEQVDREAKGSPLTLPDGSTVPRLPGYHMWMWDGEFCGSIGLRWQIGTTGCLRPAWDMSGTRWCPGNVGGATQRGRCGCCFRTHEQKGSPISR